MDFRTIDRQLFLEAVDICERELGYRLPPKPAGQQDAFGTRSKMYSANGIRYGDDDLEKIVSEVEFAMGGRVFPSGGIHRFLPGADREPSRTITDSDILEAPDIQLGIPPEDEVEGVQVTMAQSREHDWEATEMPPALDHTVVGRIIEIGARAFVADPLQAGRLSHILLRKEKAREVVGLLLAPGKKLANHGIRVGDTIKVVSSLADISGGTYVVAQHEIDDNDLTVRLALREAISYAPAYLRIPSNVSPVEGDSFLPDQDDTDGEDQDSIDE